MKTRLLFISIFFAVAALSLPGCKDKVDTIIPTDDATLLKSLKLIVFTREAEGSADYDNKIMELSNKFDGRARIIYDELADTLLSSSVFIKPTMSPATSKLEAVKITNTDKVSKYVNLLTERYFNYLDPGKIPAKALPTNILLYDYINAPYAAGAVKYLTPALMLPNFSAFTTAMLQNSNTLQKTFKGKSTQDFWVLAFRDPYLDRDSTKFKGTDAGKNSGETALQVMNRAYNDLSRYLICMTIFKGVANDVISMPEGFLNGINFEDVAEIEQNGTSNIWAIGRNMHKADPKFYRNRGLVDEISIAFSGGSLQLDRPELHSGDILFLPVVKNAAASPSSTIAVTNFSAMGTYTTNGTPASMKDKQFVAFYSYIRFALTYVDDDSYNSKAQQITSGGHANAAYQYQATNAYGPIMVPFKMNDYPIIKEKYNMVVQHFKTNYGLDLPAIARGVNM